MIHRLDSLHGVSREIEALVSAGKPVTLVLDNGSTVYERLLVPMGGLSSTGMVLYKHEKLTYNVINTSTDKIYNLRDRKRMPDASTINNQIYVTLRTLEKSGYKLMSSTNWKVI